MPNRNNFQPPAPKTRKPTLKVILVGASGVGKTCLISAYFRQAFDENAIPTVAPAYSSTDVRREDGVVVTLQIWDTAGQERYHSVSQLFFRDSEVALVCFEAGDSNCHETVLEWIKNVRDEVPTCNIVLVLTKSDLLTGVSEDELKSKIEEDFSTVNIKGIFVTSALARSGVNEAFAACADFYTLKIQMPDKGEMQHPPETEKSSCC